MALLFLVKAIQYRNYMKNPRFQISSIANKWKQSSSEASVRQTHYTTLTVCAHSCKLYQTYKHILARY